MKAIVPIRSKEELLGYFSNTPPVSECDIYLVVEVKDDRTASYEDVEDVVITSLTPPSPGVEFTQSVDALGYNGPKLDYANLEVGFVCKARDVGALSLFHVIYARQFNESGTLKFIPDKERPDIYIKLDTGFGSRILAKLIACRVSNPIPSVNPDSSESSVFKTVITYKSIETY